MISDCNKRSYAAILFGVMSMFLSLSTFASTDDAKWPRTFTNFDHSETVIPHKPLRILSTSVTLTGTLLAIDAPLIATATTPDGHFFNQWKSVAEERKLTKVWPAGSVDIEMAYAVQPDLIIVSYSGAGSALEQLALFQQIAPTIVVDYGGQTWQDLSKQLGLALGLEENVTQRIAEFDKYIQQARDEIQVPPGQANIVSYNGPGITNPIARSHSAHGLLLRALGFDIEDPNPNWEETLSHRNDFIRANYENLTQLTASTTFLLSLLSYDENGVSRFLHDPVLKNVPSVQSGRVFGLGRNSFRIDYYSAKEIVEGIKRHFPRSIER